MFGADLDTIDLVCKDIEAALKPVNGARDVLAAPIKGKGYVQIDIKREQVVILVNELEPMLRKSGTRKKLKGEP